MARGDFSLDLLDQTIRWREGKKKRKEGEEEKRRERLLLLSRFLGDLVVGVRRSKRQISSSRRGLRVETRIGEFQQTPRGRVFFLLGFYS